MGSPEIAILLVDDQEVVRSGLRRIFSSETGFAVVAECSDGDQVSAAVVEHAPDVVVMDLRMKRVGGIEATRQLSATAAPPVLALTTFDDDRLLSGALRAGASGFVLKNSSAEELIRAVRAVARGDSYLDPAVTERVLTTYRRTSEPREPQTITALTARELDVLKLMAQGLSNAEIAATLAISAVTVKTHVNHIFVKLDLRDRAAAIVYAYDHGLVSPRVVTEGPG